MKPGFESGTVTASIGMAAAKKGKGLAAKAGKHLLRLAGPPVAGFVITFLIVAHLIAPILDIAKACIEWVSTAWSAVFDLTQSEDDLRHPWNQHQDVDKTAILYQIMLDEKAIVDKERYGTEVDFVAQTQDYDLSLARKYEPRKLDSVENIDYEQFEVVWYDMMRDEHLLLSSDDMMHIFELCYENNEHMFEMDQKFYELWIYGQVVKVTTEGPVKADGSTTPGSTTIVTKETKWHTETKATSADHSDNDEVYGNLSYSWVKGEIDFAHSQATTKYDTGHMVRRFANHWQDTIALATMYSYENAENWGEAETSEYVASEKANGINSSKDYYVTQEELDEIFNLFQYKFSFYFDPVADDKYHYIKNSVAYYDNIMFVEGTTHEETGHEMPLWRYRYEKLQNNEYIPVAYRYEMIPHKLTRFAIDIAPRYIFNSFDSYTFVYTSTDNVPGYCPEDFAEEQAEPPKGMYCVGRWHTIDPYYFIEALNTLCPWWKERYETGARSHYNWVDDIVERLVYYIDLLPWTLLYERGEELTRLAELYNNQEILLIYEGTKCEEMDAYVEQYREYIEEHRPGWTLVVDYDSETKAAQFYGDKLKSTEEFYEVDYQLENVPFPSYGVTYNAETPEHMAATGGGSIDVDIFGLRDGSTRLSAWDLGGTLISLYESGFLTFEELLAATVNPEYYNRYSRYIEIEGNMYFFELQWAGSGWKLWGPAPYDKDGNYVYTVSSVGCNWYAIAAMISAKTGRCYTMEDIVRNLSPEEYGSGITINVDADGNFLPHLGDGTVVSGAGMVGDVAQTEQKLQEAGINASASAASTDIEDIRNGVAAGKMYLYYYDYEMANGETSQHWVTVTAVANDGGLVVIGDLNPEGYKIIQSWDELSKWQGTNNAIEVEFHED